MAQELVVNSPDFKKVKVRLVGEDGNAFSIMGRVKRELVRSGQKEAAEEYLERATEGDYNHLLQVTLEYVEQSDRDEDCEYCGGDGYYDDDCEACQGTGEIKKEAVK